MTERSRLTPILLVFATVALLAGGVYLWFETMAPEPVLGPELTPPAPTPAEGPADGPALPRRRLPALEESDPAVREWLATAVDSPRLARWLARPQLVRRFVATVDDVARGESPRRHLQDLDPEGGLTVDEQLDRMVLAPSSYRRYQPLATAIAGLDTAETVRLYQDLRPLFDEAYRDLGYPSGDFDKTLLAAIDELLATPIPSGPIELERAVRSYRFVDPQLEALAPAQKHLLRMGPDNARQVQSKLRLLRQVLTTGLPPEASAQ